MNFYKAVYSERQNIKIFTANTQQEAVKQAKEYASRHNGSLPSLARNMGIMRELLSVELMEDKSPMQKEAVNKRVNL